MGNNIPFFMTYEGTRQVVTVMEEKKGQKISDLVNNHKDFYPP